MYIKYVSVCHIVGTFTQVYTHVLYDTQIYMYACITQVCMFVYMSVCICIYMYVLYNTSVYVCMYVCIYVCMYICMYCMIHKCMYYVRLRI